MICHNSIIFFLIIVLIVGLQTKYFLIEFLRYGGSVPLIYYDKHGFFSRKEHIRDVTNNNYYERDSECDAFPIMIDFFVNVV